MKLIIFFLAFIMPFTIFSTDRFLELEYEKNIHDHELLIFDTALPISNEGEYEIDGRCLPAKEILMGLVNIISPTKNQYGKLKTSK